MENKVRNIVRGAIFMAACVFLLYGITRGEVVVVFTKAVNICLECIGLGGVMGKIRQSVKRKIFQIAAFGFSNVHVMNFKGGRIYQGKWKDFCNPGLNCYSCPATSFSCPIGALQAVNGSMEFNFSFYVTGLLLAFGVLFGRGICAYVPG